MPIVAASPLTIRIVLFGSYAEALERETLELSFSGPTTVAQALERIRDLPGGNHLPAKPLCALNLKQAPLDSPLASGDELAILPPLAGG
jgi:molybdopterin converting factor small subunit